MRASCLVLAWVLGSAAVPAAAAEGGGGLGQQLIQPQFGTFFWTFVTFLVMVWILGRYAWRPLLQALDAREKSIEDSIDQARRDRDEAQSLLEQHQALVAEARRERAAALDQGRADAEKLRSEILAEAQQQREQLLEQTRSQIDAGLRQARAELRTLAVDLSIRAAEKLLVKNLDDATQRRLVEDYLTGLEQSGEASSRPS
jgi:F-type H+-transporting ATPase subunit b